MHPLIENNKFLISEVCKKHHVKSLYVFGSAERATDFTDKSDVDFLYEFDLESFASWKDGSSDYIDNLADFEKQLSDLFKRKVDLIRNSNFNNQIFKNKVAAGKKLIYAK